MAERPEPIIVFHKYIHCSTTCPHCLKRFNADVTTIKTACKACGKEFEKDISNEPTSMIESLGLYINIAVGIMQNFDEFEVWATDNNREKAERLIDLLKSMGVELTKKSIERKKNPRTEAYLETYVYKMRKTSYLKLARDQAEEDSVEF